MKKILFLFILCFFSVFSVNASLSDGLIWNYTFSWTIDDSSINWYTSTSNAWLVYTGSSVEFSDDWIDLDTNQFSNLGSDAISIALRFYSYNVNSTSRYLLHARTSTSNAWIDLLVKDRSFTIGGRSQTSDSYQYVTAPADLFDHFEWVDIVAIIDYENDYISGYINWEEVMSWSVSFGSSVHNFTSSNVTVGANYSHTSYFFSWAMKDLKIYDRALTPSEIASFSSELECTTEEIPLLDWVNIHPISTWSIAEILESPSDNTYGYSTSISIDNPLQVAFFGIEDVNNFNLFTYQTWSLDFNTINNISFSDNETYMSISSSSKIGYIKMLWSYGDVNIIVYDETGTRIERRFDNIDLDSYSDGRWFAVWGNTWLVVIQFKNSILNKVIDSLEVYSIWSNNTETVEICYNPESWDYSIDGEEYVWDPYVDLVWEPEVVDPIFSEDGYIFYENWFCLNNFTAVPTWWKLVFEIQNPVWDIRETYPLSNFWLYKYWAWVCTKITTNYHEIGGKYYVRAKYIYNSLEYFPMWEDFYTYDITAPESIESIDTTYFDKDNDGDISTGEFFGWIIQIFTWISEKATEAIEGFKEIIEEFGKMWEFTLIPGAYALWEVGDTDKIWESLWYFSANEETEIMWWFNIWKAFAFFIFAWVIILVFIWIKNR